LAHQVLPVITQPTRFSSTSATLIDNMFTNRMKSGPSDHGSSFD